MGDAGLVMARKNDAAAQLALSSLVWALSELESYAVARLVARDDKKNPLISTFEWTADAAQRVLRVPAGFMRNKTQERIEELARERGASAIDLALVEDGIEIGKKMMAEMIANYPSPAAGASPGAATTAEDSARPSAAASGGPAQEPPGAAGDGYLNEVRSR